MCVQNHFISAVRGSYLKANRQCSASVWSHTSKWMTAQFVQQLYSRAICPCFAHVYLCPILLTDKHAAEKQPRCNTGKRTHLRSWRATTQKHYGSHSKICYTHSSAFLLPSSSTIKQIFGFVLVMATWRQHTQSVLVLSLLSITELSTKTIHHACTSESSGIT